MVPCSLLAPSVNVDLRAALIAASRNGTEVVVVPLPVIDAEVTFPDAFTMNDGQFYELAINLGKIVDNNISEKKR